VFAREVQVYLLGIKALSRDSHARMAAAYEFHLSGIEAALAPANVFIAGKCLSIADILFVCDFAQFLREGHSRKELAVRGFKLISAGGPTQYPRSHRHLRTLAAARIFRQSWGPISIGTGGRLRAMLTDCGAGA